MLLREGSIPIGSFREIVVARYWQMQKHAGVLATVLPTAMDKNPDKGMEIYEDYLKLAMPYAFGDKEPEVDRLEKLKGWVDKGPIKIPVPKREMTRGMPKSWKEHYLKRSSGGDGTT